jgi:hypothetical protein
MNGKQFRRKTGSRSWTGAEQKKRELAGRTPAKATGGLMLSDAIKTFHDNKEAQGVKVRVRVHPGAEAPTGILRSARAIHRWANPDS